MCKEKIAVVFGGDSSEHDVSIISGLSVIRNLDQSKYEIYPIYIDNLGIWNKSNLDLQNIPKLKVGDKYENNEEIADIISYLKKMDIIFPVLHGKYGEDGSIQGLFELIKVPYVGCDVISSSIGMDKIYMKAIFEKAKINQTKHIYIKKYNEECIYVDDSFNERKVGKEEILDIIKLKLKYPLFIKPSNSGSSVGISKVNTEIEVEKAIEYASKYDYKIIIEEGIVGKEIECSVIGNEIVEASVAGEVIPGDTFYSYNDKYKNGISKSEIPAKISNEKAMEIRNLAIKAFKAISGKGLSRVDFFLENKTNKVYINEINTLPGFTDISMYSKLWEATNKPYKEILEELIELSKDNC